MLFESELPTPRLESADTVITFAGFLDESLAEHADVVFPAETYAEKEGTVTHPDGRLQRVRQALGHASEVRPGWRVLEDLCERLGVGTGALTAPMVTARLAAAVPFYAGITLDEIGGLGRRWPEREAAAELAAEEDSSAALSDPPAAPGGLRVDERAHPVERARDRALALASLSLHACARGDLGRGRPPRGGGRRRRGAGIGERPDGRGHGRRAHAACPPEASSSSAPACPTARSSSRPPVGAPRCPPDARGHDRDDRQVDRHLRRDAPDRPARAARRAQAAGPLPVAHRTQPGRPPRAPCSRSPTC